MPTQLYTYSLIRSLYDLGDDIIDAFWPLVLTILPRDRTRLPVDKVQHAVFNEYGLAIPQHSLGTIITRAARKGYLERQEKQIALTKAGAEYYFEKIEPEREAERRVNELLADAKSFIDRNSQTPLTNAQIKEMIQGFVLTNLETIEQFFNPPERAESPPLPEFPSEAEKVLLAYFMNVEKTKPLIFRTLQDIVCGSVISAIVHTNEFFKESGKRFERTTVYIDSNYIFSLLNLRYEEENKPAQELFNLMNAENAFDFKVFDFTLHEITGLLKNYEKEQAYFHPNVKVRGSLFASLKAQGWTAARVREFIVNIEAKLWDELKIKIAPTNVNLKNYEPVDPNRRKLLERYKPDQAIREQNHDLAAIDQIRQLRRKEMKRLEKCQAMFLTADIKLALFNYVEEHKEHDTISEVIPDRLLTNILWLKNPAADKRLTLDAIIANYSRNLFVDHVVWKEFYKNVAELRNEGSLDDTQVSILLYDRHIQEVLSEYDPEEVDEIDAASILKDIERIRKTTTPTATEVAILPTVTQNLDADEQIRKDLNDLKEKVVQLEHEKHEMELNTIDRWKKLKEFEAENIAKLITFLVKSVATLAIFMLSFFLLGPLTRNWVTIEPLVWLITAVFGILLPLMGIRFDPFHWNPKMYAFVFNIVLRRKLHSLDRLELTYAVDRETEV
jgi:hypothetical protein